MELLLFIQPGCPYCRMAEQALAELTAEHPAYQAVSIRRVNELAEPALADRYDYWRVPTFYLNDTKLYEAQPGTNAAQMKQAVEKALRAALEAK